MKISLKRATLLSWLVSGLLLGGCASDSGLQKESADGSLEADLRWGAPAIPAEPLVNLSIGSLAAPFLLDTGTTELVLTSVFAERASIPKGEQGLRQEALAYAVAGSPLRVERILVVDAPPLDKDGWGGIYSPQLLTATATVVIDFLRLKLVTFGAHRGGGSSAMENCETAANAYVANHHAGMALHRFGWRGRAFGAILIEGGLVGKPPLLLDVDTGHAVSAFQPSYIGPASASGKPGPRTENLRGVEQVATTLVPGQSLQLGSLLVKDRNVAARADAGGKFPDGTRWDGNLGIDVLKDAIIVLCPVGADAIYIGMR